MHKAVYTYWVDNLKWTASFYSCLEFLCVSGYWPGKKHTLIQNIGCVSDDPRVHTKLKLVTGTYILQVNRVRFNQNEIDVTCQICHQAEETLEHFILDCTVLEPVSRPALDAILHIAYELLDRPLERDQLLQLILDSSFFFSGSDATLRQTSYRDLDMQTRRLCHSLHTERYSKLSLIPKRNRKKCNRVDVWRHTPA